MAVAYKIRGKGEVSRDEWCKDSAGVEAGTHVAGSPATAGPIISKFLSVPKRFVEEFNEIYRKEGISAFHHPDGVLEMTGKQARNAVLRIRNARDCDPGYSDYAGRNG